VSAAPDVDPRVGEVVGPFRITRPLGAGRTGPVYVARHDLLDRDVALTLISSPFASDRDFRVRFARTARTMATLDSENVVPVHTFGEHRGRLYLATELMPDGDLATALRTRGAPPLGVALDLVGQVAAGLAAAHLAGLVHLAISPAEVLLRESAGRVTACLAGLGTSVAAERHPLDVAWDIHTVGWLLWTTATGLPPYAGELPQLAGDSPQVQHVNRVLRTALAADPVRRYPSAAALRDDLRLAASLPGPAWQVATPVVRRRRGLAALVAGVAAALLLGSGGAVAAGAAMREEQPSASSLTGPTSVGETAWSDADERRAVDNIADAFGGQLFVGPSRAGCIAERWVGTVGVGLLVQERLLNDDMSFYDRDLGTADPRLGRALDDATAECMGSAG
jgi:hypothetical protein